jgi:DNA repair exonuclease SbcCD ATPase subunit
MIRTIKINGVKGYKVTYDLQPFTAITGPNYSGKTAVADAIRLALIGYVPALGKRNQATMQLAQQETMSVEAILADGNVCKRTWTRNSKGVKLTEEADIVWPSQLLDIGVWLSATPRERVSMVVGSAGRLRELATAVEAFNGTAGCDTLEALEQMIDGLREDAKFTRDEVKTYEKTLRGSTDMDADAPPVSYSPAQRNEVRQRIMEQQIKLAEAQARLSKLEQDDREADQAARALAIISDVPDDIDLEHEALTNLTQALADPTMSNRRATIAKLTEELSKAKNAQMTANAKLKSLVAEIGTPEHSLAQLAGLQPIAQSEIIAAREDLNDLAQEIGFAKSALSKSESIAGKKQEQIDNLANCHSCPTCKASQEGWRDEVLKTLRQEQDIAQQEAESACVALEVWSSKHRVTQGKLESFAKRAELIRLREKLQLESDVRLEVFNLSAQVLHLAGEIAATESAVNTSSEQELTDMLAATKRRIAAYHKTNALREQIAKRPTGDDIATAHDAIDKIQVRLTALHEEDKALAETERLAHEQLARDKMIAEARRRVDEGNEKLAQLNHQIDGLTQIMTTQHDALWGAISRACKQFAKAGQNEVQLIVRNGEIGGRYSINPWIPYEALSGAEQVMAAAAVQIGLNEKAPSKILILDELSRMNPETKAEFADRLETLLAHGAIDQVIAVDWDTEFWQARGKRCLTIDTSH